ncbi:MAG: non-canonical purine NTP pyrophosphatase, partial [Ruminococcus sp.]|nr:non-canonical purine NTP pyrophosphatase [Ruminococcus sp.]
MRLIIASSNKGKLREYSQLLSPLGYEVVSAKEAGFDVDVEETGTTFAENSALKARAIYALCHECVLADDSGLCVDALDGAPG